MSDQNIFSAGETPNQQQQSAPANTQTSSSNDSFADLLGSIKNEKGEPKYRDVNTALDALRHSQEFIPQIKTENEQLKSELNQLKEQLSKLSNIEQQVQKLTSKENTEQRTAAPALDENVVAELVTRTLSAQQLKAVQQSNIQAVVDAMKNSFGAEAEQTFYAKAAEIGMQPADINALAAKTPQAVMKLFGIADTKQQTKNITPTVGGLNTSGYNQKPESNIRRNTNGVLLGATTKDLVTEFGHAKALVQELNSQGLTPYDLTDPKVYFKHFS